MPSPFPGMDPYLEGSDFWQGFHNRLLTYLADELQPQLPPNYVATVEVRVYIERPMDTNGQSGSRVPDLEVIRTGPTKSWGRDSQRVGQFPREGVLDAPDLPEQREAFVVVRDLPSGELVTSVELLSPANKRRGDGHDQYQRKQRQLAAAGVNLIEIDLLRGGVHTALPRAQDLRELPSFHYLASVYRSETDQCELFCWSLGDPMPVIQVPLSPEDPELPLELQLLFDLTYDRSSMRRLLSYQGSPEPPLASEEAIWSDELLRAAGLRGNAGA